MEKQEWLEYWESCTFLEGMMTLYLKRNKLWESNWHEMIGTRHRFRDSEFDSDYDEFDGDFIECFIITYDDKFIKKCFLFDDFLNWQKSRSE